MEIQTEIGLQKPNYAGKTSVAVLEDVKPNSFDDRKVDVTTTEGVLRCFPHELKELVKTWGKKTEAWQDREILIGVEEYTHTKYGKQYRWNISPKVLVEEKIA